MPKILPELKKLKIGMRQSSILDAIKKYEIASVSEIIEFIQKKYDLDLSKKNVYQSIRRTIEKDLNSFCGIDGVLEKMYLDKKMGEEVPIDELKLDKNGDVKNIYNIKYYIAEGTLRIKGANLLQRYGLNFITQKSSIPEWEIYELNQGLKKDSIVILISIGNEYIALSTSQEEIPFRILIGRSSASVNVKKLKSEIIREYGDKTSILTLNHNTVSGILTERGNGHLTIEFKNDPNRVFINDLNSVNGTYWAPMEFIEISDNPSFEHNDQIEVIHLKSNIRKTPIGKLIKMTDWNRLDFDSTQYSLEDEDGNIIDPEVLNDPNTNIDLRMFEAFNLFSATELLPLAVKIGHMEIYIINTLWPGLN